jgi:hypothetical protein
MLALIGKLVLFVVLLVSTTAWADLLNAPQYDADKPGPPIPRNDLSCWIASAANMLAADHWDNNNATDLYAILKANPAFQVGTGWRGGFQDQALTYAISALNALPGYDGAEQVHVWNAFKQPWPGVTSPRSLIDALLAQDTADPADDPVGIGFWGPGIAHAVTAWGFTGNADTATQIAITDSDDVDHPNGPGGLVVNGVGLRNLNWLDGFHLDYVDQLTNRHIPVTVGYVSALREPGQPDPIPEFNIGRGFPPDYFPPVLLPAPNPIFGRIQPNPVTAFTSDPVNEAVAAPDTITIAEMGFPIRVEQLTDADEAQVPFQTYTLQGQGPNGFPNRWLFNALFVGPSDSIAFWNDPFGANITIWSDQNDGPEGPIPVDLLDILPPDFDAAPISITEDVNGNLNIPLNLLPPLVVPEPTTLALLVVGLASLSLRRRRG